MKPPEVMVWKPDPVTGRWVLEELAEPPRFPWGEVVGGTVLVASLVAALFVWGFVFTN